MSESEGEGNSETEFDIQPYQFEPQLSDDGGERSSDGASSESDGSEVEDHADSIRLGNTEWQVKNDRTLCLLPFPAASCFSL